MLKYRFLEIASLVTFTFGSLTFSVLTFSYWRERLLKGRTRHSVLPAFSLVCAAAFAVNLLMTLVRDQDSPWASGLIVALSLLTGLFPPMLFQLVYETERPGLASRGLWGWTLALFYAVSGSLSLTNGLEQAELVHMGWSEWLERAPPLMLACAGGLGFLAQLHSRRTMNRQERRFRAWSRLFLALIILSASLNLWTSDPFARASPDYLILGFFSLTLYFRAPLTFFDLLIKRGSFFALALAVLTLCLTLAPVAGDPFLSALLLTPLLLAAPRIYEWIDRLIDRAFLGRRYTPLEAERLFARSVQAPVDEEDLRIRAEQSLAEILEVPVVISFDASHQPPPEGEGSMTVTIERHGGGNGWIHAPRRPNGVPFMSDDRRLLQSLASTLAFALQNVRFRLHKKHQEERERVLKLLASRAELKALRAQIDPHFLFNALNSIAGLIARRPALADETITQLAEVFRYTLRRSEHEWVRLDEEVEFIRAYLQVEKARFGDRLRIEVSVDPAAHELTIPSMMIQPLIENAIKHGASEIEGPGEVALRVARSNGYLTIDVLDNGPGFPSGFSFHEPAEESCGHGLRNVAERLSGYFGDAGKIDWTRSGALTRVSIVIPHTGTSVAARAKS